MVGVGVGGARGMSSGRSVPGVNKVVGVGALPTLDTGGVLDLDCLVLTMTGAPMNSWSSPWMSPPLSSLVKVKRAVVVREQQRCNAPTGIKGQTLAKRVRLLGESTRSYGKPSNEVSLVRRWTSKLGRCLTQQSKRSCSEATTEKAISDKPSTVLRTRGSTKEQ